MGNGGSEAGSNFFHFQGRRSCGCYGKYVVLMFYVVLVDVVVLFVLLVSHVLSPSLKDRRVIPSSTRTLHNH